MSSPGSTLIFVYGTLKRGCSNHHVLAGQTYLGEACTAPGFALYHLGEYPGIVPASGKTSHVTGEVWSVTPAALARLDGFEGVPEGLYRRERIPLEPPFARQAVETYFYALPVTGRAEIPSGTWTE